MNRYFYLYLVTIISGSFRHIIERKIYMDYQFKIQINSKDMVCFFKITQMILIWWLTLLNQCKIYLYRLKRNSFYDVDNDTSVMWRTLQLGNMNNFGDLNPRQTLSYTTLWLEMFWLQRTISSSGHSSTNSDITSVINFRPLSFCCLCCTSNIVKTETKLKATFAATFDFRALQ